MSRTGFGKVARLERDKFLDEVSTRWKQLKAFTKEFQVFQCYSLPNLEGRKLPIDLENSSVIASITEVVPKAFDVRRKFPVPWVAPFFGVGEAFHWG